MPASPGTLLYFYEVEDAVSSDEADRHTLAGLPRAPPLQRGTAADSPPDSPTEAVPDRSVALQRTVRCSAPPPDRHCLHRT